MGWIDRLSHGLKKFMSSISIDSSREDLEEGRGRCEREALM
jgi:hypothetical protein